jgi:hypothetical protein
MRPRLAATAIVAGIALALPASTLAQPVPDHASCAAFGANVATLAQTLGPVFGATASNVATSGPAAFPALIVHPEQTALCEPRG